MKGEKRERSGGRESRERGSKGGGEEGRKVGRERNYRGIMKREREVVNEKDRGSEEERKIQRKERRIGK